MVFRVATTYRYEIYSWCGKVFNLYYLLLFRLNYTANCKAAATEEVTLGNILYFKHIPIKTNLIVDVSINIIT